MPDAVARDRRGAGAARRRASRCIASSAFASSTACDLSLSPETLEPRPDTETLVDAVLPFVRGDRRAGRRLPHPRPRHRHRRHRAGAAERGAGGDGHRRRHFGRCAGDGAPNAGAIGLGGRFTALQIGLVRKSFRPIPCNCLKPSLYTGHETLEICRARSAISTRAGAGWRRGWSRRLPDHCRRGGSDFSKPTAGSRSRSATRNDKM